MKKYILALALSFSFVSISVADTTPTPTETARGIVNALQLNEAQYLRIKNLITVRMEELRSGKTEVTAVDEKFTAALLQLLNAEQQKTYQAFVKAHPLPQIAQAK
ncbi:hypothetical protein [Rufibacter sp. XAAS-G3-1]|uniref:hypothetical protein n=1 Tax=Rufibacter sp. XAAS-G3-1 TaxID=2729134 RepID=UPI0015E77C5A|nr:hypothetical protein [Rufibacter sp. XAAS-G3-1]